MRQPDVIRGTLDDLNRPFVKLRVAGFPEPLTAFIDTGFNGSLILDQIQAEQMGLQIRSQHIVRTVLASERTEHFRLSRDALTGSAKSPSYLRSSFGS